MNKSSKPACDLRCSTAPELELKCETCPGRNELKPIPGMEPLPRWRFAMNDCDYRGMWRADDFDISDYHTMVLGNEIPGRTVWIQYERNGDTK